MWVVLAAHCFVFVLLCCFLGVGVIPPSVSGISFRGSFAFTVKQGEMLPFVLFCCLGIVLASYCFVVFVWFGVELRCTFVCVFAFPKSW